MKQLFQIFAWIGIVSIAIFFLMLGIIQHRKYFQHGYFKHLFAPLSESEEKLLNIGGIFFLVGLIFLVVSVIYHFRYGLN
jgi:hypothetical protein